MLSLYWRWMALVARNTCRRRCVAGASARAASSMSSSWQRASAHTIGPCTSRATAVTLSKSPRDAAGNPASMTSTPSSASARATRSFSGWAMLQPGDCSPSRSVVSKINTRSGSEIMVLASLPPQAACRAAATLSGRARFLAATRLRAALAVDAAGALRRRSCSHGMRARKVTPTRSICRSTSSARSFW